MMSNPSDVLAHRGFARTFAPEKLTLGLMFPMAPLLEGVPDMVGQLDLGVQADKAGFAALWSRDVPLFDPAFGDAGQIYDPWVWLGQVAARTKDITLSTAGIVLPLRHPLHVAKAASSVDVLSQGRFMLGAASGDRAVEYPAFKRPHGERGVIYRDSIDVIRSVTEQHYPEVEARAGHMSGLDVLPKPTAARLPILAIGSAQQSVQWIAQHLDAWVTYPRDLDDQKKRIGLWRSAITQKAPGAFKPFAQSLFIDLTDDPDTPPTPIFLGYRLGRNWLIDHLEALERLGANHVSFNLRHAERPAADVIDELAAEVLPHFPSHRSERKIAPLAA